MDDMAPRNEADLEPGGRVKGVAMAVVTQNRDPQGYGRVRVNLPWHADGQESYWARIATPMAGSGRGAYFLPEVGDEVLVAFDNGDMRHPFVLGGLWNGQDVPPETNTDGNNDRRVVRSRKGHELLFDDGDRGVVDLKLNDGRHLRLDDDAVTLEDGKGNTIKIESNSGALTIESVASIKIKSQQIAIEAGATLELKASGTLTIQGALVQIN